MQCVTSQSLREFFVQKKQLKEQEEYKNKAISPYSFNSEKTRKTLLLDSEIRTAKKHSKGTTSQAICNPDIHNIHWIMVEITR